MEAIPTAAYGAALAGVAIFVAAMAAGRIAERLWAPGPLAAMAGNLKYWMPATVLQMLATACVAGGAVAATNRLGGGLIVLPDQGWALIPAVAAYTIVMDFGEFLFHRTQHRLPVLWAMHSFHHSDVSMNVSTTIRHFWVEQAIKTVTIYLLVGLVFKPNIAVVSVYSAILLLNLFFHTGIAVGFGRAWFLLNSPSYHRLHHSALPEHADKNFAALFPVFDVVFGSAVPPRAGEFPPTGLHDGDVPGSLIEAVIWPARGLLRNTASGSQRAVRSVRV